MKTPLAPATLVLALGLGGLAGAAPELKLSLEAVTTVTQDGKTSEVLSEAKQVKPGDVLEQRAEPHADRAVKNARVTVPVPANTVFLAGSAGAVEGAELGYSLDGKSFSAKPTKTVKVTENGKEVVKQVPADPSEYRAVRWTLTTLEPGDAPKLRFRVRVK